MFNLIFFYFFKIINTNKIKHIIYSILYFFIISIFCCYSYNYYCFYSTNQSLLLFLNILTKVGYYNFFNNLSVQSFNVIIKNNLLYMYSIFYDSLTVYVYIYNFGIKNILILLCILIRI